MSDDSPDQPTVLRVMLRRDRIVNRKMLRYFRLELLNAAGYAVVTVILILSGLTPWLLLANLMVLGFLVLTVVRAVTSYRDGFQDGLAAYPIATAQPGPGDLVYLLEHCDEIWKPHPVQVAHQMEIMRLEREANGGISGT